MHLTSILWAPDTKPAYPQGTLVKGRGRCEKRSASGLHVQWWSIIHTVRKATEFTSRKVPVAQQDGSEVSENDKSLHFDQETRIDPKGSAGLLEGISRAIAWPGPQTFPWHSPYSSYTHLLSSTSGSQFFLLFVCEGHVTLGSILNLTISHLQSAENHNTFITRLVWGLKMLYIITVKVSNNISY